MSYRERQIQRQHIINQIEQIKELSRKYYKARKNLKRINSKLKQSKKLNEINVWQAHQYKTVRNIEQMKMKFLDMLDRCTDPEYSFFWDNPKELQALSIIDDLPND